ncbi:uncharacterized protein LOC133751229 [Lepus europaeus]|uniref:uncharacterized protein LOC133751229 n=1 Tax=Lepus europaeus TaxID=9983 RepID=UPI002B45E058|nr:uncharacterized protein LOC133751229 [Lepus europaeus]
MSHPDSFLPLGPSPARSLLVAGWGLGPFAKHPGLGTSRELLQVSLSAPPAAPLFSAGRVDRLPGALLTSLWSRCQASCRPLLHLPCPPRRLLLLAVLIPVATWAGLLPSVLPSPLRDASVSRRFLRPVAALLHLFLPRLAPRSHPTLLKGQQPGQHHPRRERHDPTGTAEGLRLDRWTTWEPLQGPPRTPAQHVWMRLSPPPGPRRSRRRESCEGRDRRGHLPPAPHPQL